MTIFSRNTRQ